MKLMIQMIWDFEVVNVVEVASIRYCYIVLNTFELDESA